MSQGRVPVCGEVSWRGLEPSNLLHVCSCGHIDDYDPLLAESRRQYLEAEREAGLEIVVAHVAGRPLGFAEIVSLETSARDVEGDHAVLLHCVNVFERGRGLGRALVAEVSRRAEAQGRGVVVDACSDVWGFMPEEFFLRLGFILAEARGRRRLMYRNLPPEARQPHYLEPRYDPPPAAGVQVLVDVFFTPLCSGRLSEEAAVMRRAAAPYGDRILVREWDASDPAIRKRFGIARAIFVNGLMRPNDDTIALDEAAALIADALARPALTQPLWDDSISRLF